MKLDYLGDVRTPIPSNYGGAFEKFEPVWRSVAEKLQSRFSSAIEETQWPQKDLVEVPVFYVQKSEIIAILKMLKDDLGYAFLADMTAVDEAPNKKRFEIVFNLFSHENFSRVRVKVRVQEDEAFPTIIGLWPGANWAEREIYDMFGIKFDGHPDLRRILMDARWEGYPLRKDYPLKGYQIFPTPEPINPELLK